MCLCQLSNKRGVVAGRLRSAAAFGWTASYTEIAVCCWKVLTLSSKSMCWTDGDLSRTGSPYDVVVTCDQDISPLQHAEDFKKAMKSGASTRKSSHSMRRVAICCLVSTCTAPLVNN